ncbi:hypothetical protein JCM15908A_12770 [Prevotella dentasini JCM 15908]
MSFVQLSGMVFGQPRRLRGEDGKGLCGMQGTALPRRADNGRQTSPGRPQAAIRPSRGGRREGAEGGTRLFFRLFFV